MLLDSSREAVSRAAGAIHIEISSCLVHSRAADYARRIGKAAPAAAGFLAALAADVDGGPSGAYDAVRLYERWLSGDEGLTYSIQNQKGTLWFWVGDTPPGTPVSKLDFLLRLNRDRTSYYLYGGLLAAVRQLYREGRVDEAFAEIRMQMARRGHFLLEPALRVLELTRAGEEIPPHLQDVFGESDYFRKKFCTLPFYEMTIDVNGQAFACCPSYLNLPVGNILTGEMTDITNSEMAVKIRKSILDGTFTYCNRSACSFIAGDNLPSREKAREHPFFRKVIDESMVELDRVHRIALALDRSCNLSCPSCRSEIIIEKGETVATMMEATRRVLIPMLRRGVQTLQMNGYGEFAMSEPCRLILATINPQEYPDLKLDLITNGLLFDHGFWRKFPNVHSMIRQVRVSIDGVTAPTYNKLRRGGDFEKLRRNMEFLAGLRREGYFGELAILFVYQQANFREMKAMAEWAISLGIDRLYFEKILDWGSFGSADGYRTQAVHQPGHPEHQEFRELVADPIFNHPIVVRDWTYRDYALVDPRRLRFMPLVVHAGADEDLVTFSCAGDISSHAALVAQRTPGIAQLLRAIGRDLTGQATCSYEAIALYDRWIANDDDQAAYAIARDPESMRHIATIRPQGVPASRLDKAHFLLRLNAEKWGQFLHGGIFAAARTLFRAGEIAAAHAALQAQAQRELHFINEQALAVTGLALAGEPIPEHLADVFGDSDYFGDRFCTKPFQVAEFEANGALFTCHADFINLPVGSASDKTSALNSEMALKIRRSIHDGSFRYCNRIRCTEISCGRLPRRGQVAQDPSMRAIIEARTTILPRT